MSIYEQWITSAFTQDGKSNEEVWSDYLPKEQKIYEEIIEKKIATIEGSVKAIADKYGLTVEYAVAFIDGINDILPTPYDVNTLEETTAVKIEIDFKKLYMKMVEYKAEHLYSLPQWDNVFTEAERKDLFIEQKKSRTIVNSLKIGRNDPCPCNSGKKYKKCCGA